tara:strand:+ start:690 stop:1013 length:324 start_codon:yes stop_codon:yes gene_type:complete
MNIEAMIEETINNIITTLYSDPIYLIIGVVLSALLLYSLLKKLVKFVMYMLAIIVLYLAYLYYSGREIPKNVDELMNQGKQTIEKVGGQMMDNIDKIIKDNTEKKGQ